MKSEKLTNTLLALIVLALVANVAVPILRANEASEVSKALLEIAESNRQIASAIRDNAKSSEHIADSLQNVARQVKGIGLKAGAPSSRGASAPRVSPEEREEDDPNWWKNYIEE